MFQVYVHLRSPLVFVVALGKFAAELILSVASSHQGAFPSPRSSLRDLIFVRDPRGILGISWAVSSQAKDDRRTTPAVDRLTASALRPCGGRMKSESATTHYDARSPVRQNTGKSDHGRLVSQNSSYQLHRSSVLPFSCPPSPPLKTLLKMEWRPGLPDRGRRPRHFSYLPFAGSRSCFLRPSEQPRDLHRCSER